jgi:hypothetical protein
MVFSYMLMPMSMSIGAKDELGQLQKKVAQGPLSGLAAF